MKCHIFESNLYKSVKEDIAATDWKKNYESEGRFIKTKKDKELGFMETWTGVKFDSSFKDTFFMYNEIEYFVSNIEEIIDFKILK